MRFSAGDFGHRHNYRKLSIIKSFLLIWSGMFCWDCHRAHKTSKNQLWGTKSIWGATAAYIQQHFWHCYYSMFPPSEETVQWLNEIDGSASTGNMTATGPRNEQSSFLGQKIHGPQVLVCRKLVRKPRTQCWSSSSCSNQSDIPVAGAQLLACPRGKKIWMADGQKNVKQPAKVYLVYY